MIPPALRSASFRRLWTAGMVSSIGTQVSVTGSAWLLFRLTGSPTSIGTCGLVFSITITLVPFLAGGLVDRTDPRRLYVALLAVEVLSAGVLTALAAEDLLKPVYFYAAAVVDGCRLSFSIATQTRLMPATVRADELQSAQALSTMIWPASALIGPAVAGVILSYARPVWIFAANTGLTATALMVIFGLRTATAPLKLRPPMTAGLRHLAGARWPLALFALTFTVSAVTVGVDSLLPVFAVRDLRAGVGTYSLLRIAAGASALMTGVVTALLPPSGRPVRSAVVLVFLCQATFAVLALPAGLVAAAAAVCAGTLFGTVAQILIATYLQGRVPARYRGSVGGMNAVCQSGLAGVAAGGMGLAAGVSALSTVIAVSVGLAALSAVVATVIAGSALRRSPPGVSPTPG